MQMSNMEISPSSCRLPAYRSQTHTVLASLGPRAPSRSQPKPTWARSLLHHSHQSLLIITLTPCQSTAARRTAGRCRS